MADSILARLRGDNNPVPPRTLDLEINPLPPKPLNIQPLQQVAPIQPHTAYKPQPPPQQVAPEQPVYWHRDEISQPKPTHARSAPRFHTRPVSIAAAIDTFGNANVDGLLGHLVDAEQSSADVHNASLWASTIRRILTALIMLCSASSTVLGASPICQGEKNDPRYTKCISDASMASAVISAIACVLIFILEKTAARNSSVRLRDLSSDFDALAVDLRQALYVCPPEQSQASHFVDSINQRASNLKARALAAKIRPPPRRNQRRTEQV